MAEKANGNSALKAAVILIFVVFGGYLLLQFSRVFIYYDDYGYLSLSYAYVMEEVAGTDYNLSQLLEYMGHHYFYSNGRLLCTFLYLLLYLAGGLKLLQVFMAAAVLAVAVLSYRAAVMTQSPGTGTGRIMTAVFTCLLYGLIGIHVKRHGIYWFAASFLYIVPAVSVIGLGRMYCGTIRRKRSPIWWLGCTVLAFLGTFSQEQWLVAVLALILSVMAYKQYVLHGTDTGTGEGRICLRDFQVLAAAAAGALPILTSPAVKDRMARDAAFAERSFIGKVMYNIDVVTRLFFAPDNQNYIFLLLIMAMAMTAVMMARGQGNRRAHVLFLTASAAAGAYIFTECYVWGHGDRSQYLTGAVWLLFVYVLWMTARFLYFAFSNNNIFQGMLCIAGFFSMACLVIVPELPERVLVPYVLLSFSMLGYIFGEVFIKDIRLRKFGGVFLLCMAAISLPNMRNIYRGYSANWKVHQYNDVVLRQNAEMIKQGERIKEVRLYRLLDELCTKEMVYDPGFDFMIFWMYEYYDFPPNVAFLYETVGDMQDLIIQEKRD